jgi:hypothetical protein
MRALIGGCALAMLCVACTSPSERANRKDAEPADSALHDPPTDPRAYRVECVIFELPLAIAEELNGHAAESDATLGAAVDAARCREALEILQPRNPAITRCARPRIELALDHLTRVPPRTATSEHPAGSLASDHLELSLRVRGSTGWAPLDLETQIRWTDAAGRALGRLPSSTSPLPAGEWIEIVCLPSTADANERHVPAIFAFVALAPER